MPSRPHSNVVNQAEHLRAKDEVGYNRAPMTTLLKLN